MKVHKLRCKLTNCHFTRHGKLAQSSDNTFLSENELQSLLYALFSGKQSWEINDIEIETYTLVNSDEPCLISIKDIKTDVEKDRVMDILLNGKEQKEDEGEWVPYIDELPEYTDSNEDWHEK